MKNQIMTSPNNGKHSWLIQRITLAFFSLLLALSMNSIAIGQDLDDFKYCAGRDGVESIPYNSLKSSAKSAEYSKKSAESKAKSEFGYKALKLRKSQATNKLKAEKKVFEAAEDKLEEQRKYLPDDVDKQERAVKESEERIEEIEEDLEDIEKDIYYGMNVWKQVALARGKVRVCFDKVLDELSRSLRDPEDYIGSKPSDSEDLKKWNADLALFKRYINTIKGKIEDAEEGHAIAERQAYEIVDNLDDL